MRADDVSLNREGFGLLLPVVAFSAGPALVFAWRAMSRVRVNRVVARAVPVASVALVVAVGLLIT